MTPDLEGGSDGQTQEVLQEVARSTGGQCILSVAGGSLRCTGGGTVRSQELHRHVRLWSAQDKPAAPICAAGERCPQPRCVQRRVSHAGSHSLRAGVPELCLGIRQIPRPGFERRVRGRRQIVVRGLRARQERPAGSLGQRLCGQSPHGAGLAKSARQKRVRGGSGSPPNAAAETQDRHGGRAFFAAVPLPRPY